MDWAVRLAERRATVSESPSCKVPKVTKGSFGTSGTKQDGRFQNSRATKPGLLARCREACEGLPLSPARLLAELNEADKAAMRSGDPDELKALRAMAEILAERERPALDAKIEKAYRWLRAELAKRPDRHRETLVIDPDAEPVLIAVAVRGVGCATLKVKRTNYAGREFELLELIHRTDTPRVPR